MDYDEQQEAIKALIEARKFVQQAHDKAEDRHDTYGDDYMSGALYEVMEGTKDLLARIDALLKSANTGKYKWTACIERLPMPKDGHDGYFWCLDERKPEEEPRILEAWERDGVPRGFCHESSGVCSWVTHWMPVTPPTPLPGK